MSGADSPISELQSFTSAAVLDLVLHLFLGLPGLIMNVVHLHEATKHERRTGAPPEGKGCLLALLWVCGTGLLLACVLLVAR